MAGRPFGRDSDAYNYGTMSDQANGFSSDTFLRLNESVSNSVMAIKQNTQALVSLEKQIGTSYDSNDIRKRIQMLIKSTTHKVVTSKQQLSELMLTAKQTGDKRQQLTANSVQQSLTSATTSFNTVAERVLGKLQEYPQPARMSTPQSGYLDSGELDIRDDTAQLVRSSPQQQRQSQQLSVSSEASYLEERAERMVDLERDITQLHEIMGEIGQMVVAQGETIDTIEKHTEHATVNVVEANNQLESAVKLKRCSRKLTCVIACFVGTIAAIIIIVIIIVAVVLSNQNKK